MLRPGRLFPPSVTAPALPSLTVPAGLGLIGLCLTPAGAVLSGGVTASCPVLAAIGGACLGLFKAELLLTDGAGGPRVIAKTALRVIARATLLRTIAEAAPPRFIAKTALHAIAEAGLRGCVCFHGVLLEGA